MKNQLLIPIFLVISTISYGFQSNMTVQEIFEASLENAYAGNNHSASFLFSKIYESETIYYQNFREYNDMQFLPHLSHDCLHKFGEKEILFLNYAHHLPFQKAILTHFLKYFYDTKSIYRNIIFINNPPIEEENCDIHEYTEIYKKEKDPQYNVMINTAKDLGYFIKTINNASPLRDVNQNLNEICEFLDKNIEGKTVIICNSTFNIDTQEKSAYEELLLQGLKDVNKKEAVAISQTDDLYYYPKSKWRSSYDFFLYADEKKNFFSHSDVYDAFLFTKYEYTRNSTAILLEKEMYPIDRFHKKAKIVKAYRFKKGSNGDVKDADLEDIAPVSYNKISYLMLEPDTEYLLRFEDENAKIVSEKEFLATKLNNN